MKRLSIFYLMIVVSIIFSGCEEFEHKPISSDVGKLPQSISSPIVTNEPGGATISYKLPDEADILYVKAEYKLADGKQYESRSSIYKDSIKVDGFADTNEHTVALYAVNRNENISKPVLVTIQPETPPVHAVRSSMRITPDFGGVQFSWHNETNSPLSFLIYSPDSISGELALVETHYSGVTDGDFTLRGFPPEEETFAVIVRDRWNNFSDTVKATLTPMYEILLDRKKMDVIYVPGDIKELGWGTRWEALFDDNYSTVVHSNAGTGWPHSFTVDLGVQAYISRFKLHPRITNPYGHGNPRLLEVWTTNEDPPFDGSFDKWHKIGDFVARKPSLEGGTAQDDAQHLKDGDEYPFKLSDPACRYVRIIVHETWGLTGFIHIMQLQFWGEVISE